VPDFVALLDEMRDIRGAQSGNIADEPLWSHAQPRGIRYGFLVEAIHCGIILTKAER
jgi:hypothetical protein